MPNPFSSSEINVTFTPESGSSLSVLRTYDDNDMYMLEPTYASKKKKEILVSLPYRDGELDFSDVYQDRSFFESSEVTYRFVWQGTPDDEGAVDMKTLHRSFENYCWSFKGSISDDYGAVSLTEARCISFTATPFPGDNTLTIEVTFRGVRT